MRDMHKPRTSEASEPILRLSEAKELVFLSFLLFSSRYFLRSGFFILRYFAFYGILYGSVRIMVFFTVRFFIFCDIFYFSVFFANERSE